MKLGGTDNTDLLANETNRKKFHILSDLLTEIESHVRFAAQASEADRVASLRIRPRWGRLSSTTGTVCWAISFHPQPLPPKWHRCGGGGIVRRASSGAKKDRGQELYSGSGA